MERKELSEVAADVAAALGLDHSIAWISLTGEVLEMDGSNLTDPYWRCACEDWLQDNGYSFACSGLARSGTEENEVWKLDSPAIGIQCPWAEFPARAVSAVYRHMQEER